MREAGTGPLPEAVAVGVGDQAVGLAASGVVEGDALMAGTPCLWTLDPGCCQAVWDAAGPVLQTKASQFATQVLWALTGRRFGPCALTVRPCVPQSHGTYVTYGVWSDSGSGGSGQWFPMVWEGAWRNCGCGAGACACVPDSEVWLPGPVAGVSEVRVDNVVVPSSAYRIDDGVWLVRQDGGSWPAQQTMGNPASSVDDTFVVTYLRGLLVPDGGSAAAGALACEYIKACNGQPCRFPKRVTSVSRQGVTVSAQETVAAGSTGLPEVDQWVRVFNPRGLAARPEVFNPDLPAPRVTTWAI